MDKKILELFNLAIESSKSKNLKPSQKRRLAIYIEVGISAAQKHVDKLNEEIGRPTY